jgi:hypothetical protein
MVMVMVMVIGYTNEGGSSDTPRDTCEWHETILGSSEMSVLLGVG